MQNRYKVWRVKSHIASELGPLRLALRTVRCTAVESELRPTGWCEHENPKTMAARGRTSIRTDLAAEDVDADVVEFIDMRLRASADTWPTHLEPAPVTTESVLDSNGRFGPEARGIEVRMCDDERKGLGAFATRNIPAQAVAGVYWGEQLTARQHALRHVIATPLERLCLLAVTFRPNQRHTFELLSSIRAGDCISSSLTQPSWSWRSSRSASRGSQA